MNTNSTQIKNEIVNEIINFAEVSSPRTTLVACNSGGPLKASEPPVPDPPLKVSPSPSLKVSESPSLTVADLASASRPLDPVPAALAQMYPAVVQCLLRLVKARKGSSSPPPLSHSLKPSAEDPNFVLSEDNHRCHPRTTRPPAQQVFVVGTKYPGRRHRSSRQS